MSRTKLSELLRDHMPVVAVGFTDTAGIAGEAIAAGVDVAELRIDWFSSREADHVVGKVREFEDIPTIATIRSHDEGGDWAGSEPERASLFEAVTPYVDAIDVELSSEAIRDRVVAAAKKAGKTVIISHHDFDSTPENQTLENIADRARRHGADYVKISAMADSLEDVRSLAEFTLKNADLGVIVIAMGAQGAVSRVFFPCLGSRLTYSFIGNRMAPGQLPYEDMFELMRKFYPQFNQRKIACLELLEDF